MKEDLVLIVGNGFDISHGYKTSYSDFIKSEQLKDKNNIFINYFKNKLKVEQWVDVEEAIQELITQYVEIKTINTRINIVDSIDKKYYELMLFLCPRNSISYAEKLLDSGNPMIDFGKLKASIDNKFLEESKHWDYNKIERVIKEDFDKLKDELKEYLEKETKGSVKTKFMDIFKAYNNKIALNFNYTNTLDKYNLGFQNIFIHGSLESKIVLGHNLIPDINFSYMNKEIQMLKEGFNYIYEIKKIKTDCVENKNNKYAIVVIGHSLDKNDQKSIIKILKQLDATKTNNISNIIIYYYIDKAKNNSIDKYSDQFNKAYNIKNMLISIEENFYEELLKYDKIKFKPLDN